MKHVFLYGSFLLLGLLSCTNKKKTILRQSYFYYSNSFYTGSYPNSQSFAAQMEVINVDGHVKFEVALLGIPPASGDSFSVHIHKKDLTQPFGYSGNPVIDLGHFKMGHTVVWTEVPDMTFDYFTKEFQGFFIAHDPTNIQNDTTTLLIYGKAGAVE